MQRKTKYLLLIFGVFLLIFNYPITSIFDKPILVMGYPLFVWYLFGAWIVIIGLLFVLVERKSKEN